MDVDWSIKMKSPRNHKWIRNMFFICLLAVFACVILFHFISVTQDIQFEPEKQTQLSDAWMLNGTQTISFPAELTAKKGEPLVLSCKLPEDISENDALFLMPPIVVRKFMWTAKKSITLQTHPNCLLAIPSDLPMHWLICSRNMPAKL